MASFIAKKISTKILGESFENKWGAKDPIFENVPATRLDGKPNGKMKKVKRALPPGLSDNDAMILNKVKRRAYKLDLSLFSIAGVRFGWSSVIGLVPFFGNSAGDFVDFFMAAMVINTAKKVDGGLPSSLVLKMWIWAIIDLIVGFVPFLGDIFDAVIKANARNAVYLEEHLRAKGKQNLRKSGMPVPELDPSDPREFDRLQNEPEGRRDGHRTQTSGVTSAPDLPARPSDARVHEESRSGGGFFGFGGNRSRRADEEMGRDSQPPTRNSTRRG
ncbi:ph domain-containing protein [Seiridium cupressi]